jgi:hypothetical protein
MAKQDGRDDEIDALLEGNDVDPEKVAAQIKTKRGGGTPEPEKPEDKKPDKSEEKKPDEKKPDEHKEVPDPEIIKAAMLNEMFGEQFKTVEDFKKANIPDQLQELATLRRKNQELETQVKAKPKHAFANDDIAKFNEFVRETGIKDAGIFNKLSASDVANMKPMDALVLQRIIDDPTLAGKEPQVQRSLERRFNVDPKKVEAGELTQEEFDDNLLEVNSEGNKAKAKLQDLKGKIKMPEIPADLPPDGKIKWTPEIEKAQKDGWTKTTEAMVKEFSTIPIPIKGSKEPIVTFVLPEETRKLIMDKYSNLAVSNQMEVNDAANVKNVAIQMYSEAILSNLEEITHAIFDRARSMKEEEYLEKYSHPSSKNTDKPDMREGPLSDEEKADKAFQAELNGR